MLNELSRFMRFKRRVLWVILASAVSFAVLCFVPNSRQGEVFPYDAVCDYRKCILPVTKCAQTYEPDGVLCRDACYPPIAYCMVKMLSSDKGSGWVLSDGEMRLLASIAILQIVGVLLLVGREPGLGARCAAAS